MQRQSSILVLEDDPDIGLMIRMILEQKRNYKVIVCETTQKARSILANSLISVIIMDLLLSGDDGADMSRSLKADKKTCSLPILMISAHPKGKEICQQAGADDFLAKPFEIADLLSKVDSLAKKSVGSYSNNNSYLAT